MILFENITEDYTSDVITIPNDLILTVTGRYGSASVVVDIDIGAGYVPFCTFTASSLHILRLRLGDGASIKLRVVGSNGTNLTAAYLNCS